MAIALDRVLCIGDVAVAAVAERRLEPVPAGALAIVGYKRPVAVLIRRAGVTAAFDPEGRPIAPADLDRRFPGCREAFEKAADDEGARA